MDISTIPFIRDLVLNGSQTDFEFYTVYHPYGNGSFVRYNALQVDKSVTLITGEPVAEAPIIGVAIDDANFPDDNFRAIVEQYDIDHNGALSEEELAAVTEIKCNGKNITSLKGIENFANLKNLDCTNNQLTSLGLSQNAALEQLNCYGNKLKTLDVSGCRSLTILDCDRNQLTDVNVSQNTALTRLSCSYNQLTGLDVSDCMALTMLNCYGNQLTSLDVSNNTALTWLGCGRNQLSYLDVSQNIVLKNLICYENDLSYLDVSRNTALTNLDCYANPLGMLDISAVPAIFDAVVNGSFTSNAYSDTYYSPQGILTLDKEVSIITENDIVTNVELISQNYSTSDIYDIMGRKVLDAGGDIHTLQSGIYIMHRRKIVVR